jgi:hypothetical protein
LIRKAGYKLKYIPQCHIYHIGGASSKSSTKKKEGYIKPFIHYYNFRNSIIVAKRYLKFHHWILALPYQLAYYLTMVLYFIVRGRWSKLNAVSRALADGFMKS